MKYKILKVGKGAARKRMLEWGLLPGTIVELIRVAPLGDPMELKVRGCQITIRATEWETLTVEPVPIDKKTCGKTCCK